MYNIPLSVYVAQKQFIIIWKCPYYTGLWAIRVFNEIYNYVMPVHYKNKN